MIPYGIRNAVSVNDASILWPDKLHQRRHVQKVPDITLIHERAQRDVKHVDRLPLDHKTPYHP